MVAQQSDKIETMEAEDRQKTERDEMHGQNDGLDGRHQLALILLAAAIVTTPAVTRSFGFSGFVLAYAAAALAWWALRNRSVSFASVITIALVLRLSVAFASPLLSTDVYRYFWDGTVLSAGINPYRYAPDDPRLASLRAPWHSQINHPEVRAIYPPHAQLLFGAVHHLVPWRALLIACDLLTLLFLRRHTRYLLAVATFPPLIIEGIWSAHIDAISAMLMTRAVIATSGVALAVAAGLKLIPLAALPALILSALRRRAEERRPEDGGPAAGTAALLGSFLAIFTLPFFFFAASGSVMPGLRDFATRWIFNSPLYSLCLSVIETLRVDAVLKEAWTLVKDPFERFSTAVYSHLYTDFIARCALALLAAILIARLSRHRFGAIHAVGALLICSPVIHPWYWLTIAPLAVAYRVDPWRLLALFAPLSYLLYDGVQPWIVFALCYGVPLLLSVRTRLSTIVTSAAEWHRGGTRFRRGPDTFQS